jgi:hypothetical protein
MAEPTPTEPGTPGGIPGGISWYEAQASPTVLLAFDGRVLEVFGFTDTHRYHIWQEPRLEFSHGRRPTATITSGRGLHLWFPYDAHRFDGLRALADRLARSLADHGVWPTPPQ